MTARLRVCDAEHVLLCEVGDFLGGLRRGDLRRLCEFEARRGVGDAASPRQRRAERSARKRDLTAAASARIAGSINRANNAEWALAWRNLKACRATLEAQIKTLRRRVAVPAGERDGKTRGYRTEAERAEKRRRLQMRRAELERVERRIRQRRPSVCVGGSARARRRHNLAAAQMSLEEWRADWWASRMFLSFAGESGKPHGNDTLRVDPVTGIAELNLPAVFAARANVAGRRLYRFRFPVVFDRSCPGFAAWERRARNGAAVAYRLRLDPSARRGNGMWRITASWNDEPAAPAGLDALRLAPTLGVDLNAGWIAASAVDADGNPFGRPASVAVPQHGHSAARRGRLRAAIQELGEHALRLGCASITVENLDFADARDTGRETMGRGRRGKQFRRQVAGIPTAQLAADAPAMLARMGISVIAVDAAYTTKWAAQQKWRETLNCSEHHPCSGHHAAAAVIARRGLGLSARRSKAKQSIGRCSCPDRHPAAGTGARTDTTRRGHRKRPAPTAPQPQPRHKTRTAQTGHARQRNATPFGVAPNRATPTGGTVRGG